MVLELPIQNPWFLYKFKHICQVVLILSHIIKTNIYLVKKLRNLKHHWPSSFLGHQFQILASLSNMLAQVFIFSHSLQGERFKDTSEK